ncbi:MAG: SIS domain-containing protein [Desulfitobacteriaceae bacterium]
MERNIPDSMRPAFVRTSHPFYMWDELMQTPNALRFVLVPEVQDSIQKAAMAIRDVDLVYLLGCGTSYFSAIAGTYFFHRVAGCNAQAHNAFEFSAYPPANLARSAVVAISHTGGTSVVLDSLVLAEKEGAVRIGLTDVDDSPLAKMASYVFLGGGGREKPLPKTRSYVTSLLKHYLLAVEVGTKRGTNDVLKLKSFLEESPEVSQKVLEDNLSLVHDIALNLSQSAQFFLFGAGPNTASVMEGTLKLQETAQARVHAFELEEGMHGPWVTMERDDLVIIYALKGPSFNKTKGFIQAIASVGAKIWVLTDDLAGISGATYETYLPDVPEIISPLYAVLPIYEFTYYLALSRGIRPDVMRLTDDRYLDARLKLPR